MSAFNLDLLGGMAGDMFVAALLDLRPDLEAGLHAVLSACPLLDGIDAALADHNDGVLSGKRFRVTKAKDTKALATAHHHGHHHAHDHHTHDHGHGHGDHDASHVHVAWRSIRDTLEHMTAPAAVTGRAIAIFSELADAEARVHGTTVDEVTFHEVGAWDSIADILAAAYLIEATGPASWSAGAVPLGSGRIKTAHGLLPVPAPATVLLLEGFRMVDDGIGGERVTPPGAAILRLLCRNTADVVQTGRLDGAGHGFGTRRLPGISNCLRILAFRQAAPATHDRVAVLECEIDDQTGEDIAIALAHIRNHPGVLDATQAVVFGKKGRLMIHLQVLAMPAASDAVARLIFDETATLGIRRTITERLTLPRRSHMATVAGHDMPAKSAMRPSGETMKLEADALAAVTGMAERRRIRNAAETDRS